MAGGTVFHFVTDGVCAAGLTDDVPLAVRPVVLGWGEHLWNAIDARALGDACVESVAGERAMHVLLRRQE